LTSDHLIIDDARDYLPLFQIDRVSGPYAGETLTMSPILLKEYLAAETTPGI